MKVLVLQTAEEHLAEGVQFYEDQAEGLGLAFLRALLADIAVLARNGGVHRLSFGFHRCVAKRFPHAIYYSLVGDTVKVHAILDCRRSPDWIRRTLEES